MPARRRRSRSRPRSRLAQLESVLKVRRDTVDFRDRMFVPTLTEVPEVRTLPDYRRALRRHAARAPIPVLDQGTEGACTGFALAAVVHYLLHTREVNPDRGLVSARMLYEMAKRYDEWPGEDYEGSSARGAMKGWHHHGVCLEESWPSTGEPCPDCLDGDLAREAMRRPLGAYFRVDHTDLVAMHTALAETGILYATSTVHEGWDEPDSRGHIAYSDRPAGGHAYAIVGYDDRGFWIQNSWGPDWGKSGFARLGYEDWLENGMDVWVARLGVPIEPVEAAGAAAGRSALARQESYNHADLRPHIVSLGNDGRLRATGTFGTSEADLDTILARDFPRVTAGWPKKRLLLFAHGGLVGEKSALARVADYRAALLDQGVYPLAFVWRTDWWTTTKNILKDALGRRRAEGILDSAQDFLLDRLDDTLEPIARLATGRSQWSEMKENALLASAPGGGARALLERIAADPAFDDVEIHVAAHSAGSILMGPVVRRLTAPAAAPLAAPPFGGAAGLGRKIRTCTLWAPACRTDLFHEMYRPGVENRSIQRMRLCTLTDAAEQDDHCANIYHKSLLYLVSNAFEDRPRIPLIRDGVSILGMDKFVRKDRRLGRLIRDGRMEHVLSPNEEAVGSSRASTARHHGDFDDDEAAVKGIVAFMLGRAKVTARVSFEASKSARSDRRQALPTT